MAIRRGGMPDTRTFEGERYKLYTRSRRTDLKAKGGLSFSRVTANRIASELRNKGYSVRVIPYGSSYCVYKRRK